MRSILFLAVAFVGFGCSHVRVGVDGSAYVPTLHSRETRVSHAMADVAVSTADDVSPMNPAKSVRITVHNRSASKPLEVVWDRLVALTPGGVTHPLISGALKTGESFPDGHPVATMSHANAFVPPGAMAVLEAFPGDRADLFDAIPPQKPTAGQVVEQGSVVVPLLSEGLTDYVTVPIAYATDAGNSGKRRVERFSFGTQFEIPLPVNILFGYLCFQTVGILCATYLIFPLPGQDEEARLRAAAWLKTKYGPGVEVIESHAYRLGY